MNQTTKILLGVLLLVLLVVGAYFLFRDSSSYEPCDGEVKMEFFVRPEWLELLSSVPEAHWYYMTEDGDYEKIDASEVAEMAEDGMVFVLKGKSEDDYECVRFTIDVDAELPGQLPPPPPPTAPVPDPPNSSAPCGGEWVEQLRFHPSVLFMIPPNPKVKWYHRENGQWAEVSVTGLRNLAVHGEELVRHAPEDARLFPGCLYVLIDEIDGINPALGLPEPARKRKHRGRYRSCY